MVEPVHNPPLMMMKTSHRQQAPVGQRTVWYRTHTREGGGRGKDKVLSTWPPLYDVVQSTYLLV